MTKVVEILLGVGLGLALIGLFATIPINARKDIKEIRRAVTELSTDSFKVGYLSACSDHQIKCDLKQMEISSHNFSEKLEKK